MVKIKSVFLFVTALVFTGLVFAGSVLAAETISLQIDQPRSPTNQQGFSLSFGVLDIPGLPVTVRCTIKGPGDSSFKQAGSAVNLPAGGGHGSCNIPSFLVNNAGDYYYQVSATDGTNSTARTVMVTYSNNNPSGISDYQKTQLNRCDYRITFKTGDGTDRVEIYRSDKLSFNADSGTLVSGINIGSNQTGQITNAVPDCTKTYYFAIRAFNIAGNASPIGGDRDVINTIVTTTPKVTRGAIPVSATPSTEGEAEVLGEGTQSAALEVSPTPVPVTDLNTSLSQTAKSPWVWIIVLGLVGLLFLIIKRRDQKV